MNDDFIKIVYIILWLLTILGFDVYNWYIIEKKHININHGQQLVNRVIFGLVFLIFVIITYRSAFEVLNFFGFECFSFFTFFNIVLNEERRKGIFYIGVEEKESNNTDKVLRYIFNRVPPEFVYWCTFVITILFAYNFAIGQDRFNGLMGW